MLYLNFEDVVAFAFQIKSTILKKKLVPSSNVQLYTLFSVIQFRFYDQRRSEDLHHDINKKAKKLLRIQVRRK